MQLAMRCHTVFLDSPLTEPGGRRLLGRHCRSCLPCSLDCHSAGTFAWAAPEVLTAGKCTEKADIFSFGESQLSMMSMISMDEHNSSFTEQSDHTVHVCLTWRLMWLGIVLWEIVTGEQPVRGKQRDVR